MKPGTPCVIAPKGDTPNCADHIAQQVAGLLVVTHAPWGDRSWDVRPRPIIVLQEPTFDHYGRAGVPGDRCEFYPPESWLRPLRGDPAPAERIDVTECAHA